MNFDTIKGISRGFIRYDGQSVQLQTEAQEIAFNADFESNGEALKNFQKIISEMEQDKTISFQFLVIPDAEKTKTLEFDNGGGRQGFLMIKGAIVTETDRNGLEISSTVCDDFAEASGVFDIKMHSIFEDVRSKAVFDDKLGRVVMPKGVIQRFVECPQPQRVYFEQNRTVGETPTIEPKT